MIVVRFLKRMAIGLAIGGILWGRAMTCNPSDLPRAGASAHSWAKEPKNIILLIGDGMGLAQISASLYSSDNRSVFESFPVIGFHKSFSASDLITDSAAGATAFACGIKTYNNAIGLSADTLPCYTILEEAEEHGLATGLVATSSITHATPAAFIAHQPFRTMYEDIAADFLQTEIDLFIGGGKKYFDRRQSDERDLIAELRSKGYTVNDYFYSDLSLYSKFDPSKNFVFFTSDDKPVLAMQGRNYLPLAAKLAPPFLRERSKKGFFLMMEGSQIDWQCHANNGYSLLPEMKDFEDAVANVLRFALEDRETLVIVTADHETGGLAINPGSKLNKLDLAFTTNGHTAALIPVFALGPGAEAFSGIYENTALYRKMREAFGWATIAAPPTTGMN